MAHNNDKLFTPSRQDLLGSLTLVERLQTSCFEMITRAQEVNILIVMEHLGTRKKLSVLKI